MPPRTTTVPGAEAFFPARLSSLTALRKAAAGCRGCPLFAHATQTVFGRGPAGARIMLVGEQPGDEEDRRGLPFVGPAGRVLDEALTAAELSPEGIYTTNVVKHFKWTRRGKRRMHSKPDQREIGACLPWLRQEIAVVAPAVLVGLGATAAQALFGREFRVTRQRGEPVQSALAPHALATFHPAAILRQRSSAERERHMACLVADLRLAMTLARGDR